MVKQQEKVDYSVLEKVKFPEDIRKLNIPELNTLAQEIRSLIVNTVASSGGHLASSLGTVELTLALHFVFNTPQDKVIWDGTIAMPRQEKTVGGPQENAGED